ncbi:glutamate receptor ionotropic, delta-2 [Monomorium pharaonis]|uniref:glutamate receptor ionotropic, delta-2 n=1 Tax=Monomorium pharaonis TaxID=307658 RepID=UPI00102E1DBC|nr:glutamate receptor ionotropic, delta-2 [Monomorium pharaonis]
MHSIHKVADLEERIYDNFEHRNLYMLDLDCDSAIEILRQAHSKGLFVAPMKWLLLQDRRVVTSNVTVNSTYDNSVFEDLAVYPDSDVVLAQRFDGDFFHLMSVYRPSPQRTVIWENRGNWTVENGLQMSTFDVASARRRNLQQTVLKSCIVMTNPDTINHLTDYKYNTIDPITKANYLWLHHLVSRMNATVNIYVANDWGAYDNNGSWNGMIGMLQRREIDIGGTHVWLLAHRIHIVEHIQLYTRTGLCFVFRQPLLSTIKNIFILPFQRHVWIAIAIFLILVFCLLYISVKWEHHRGTSAHWKQLNVDNPTVTDNFFILLGAVTQQGYSYEPYRVPSRIVTLMLLLASLSLYAAYTANIVALLQSTTDSIKTLSNLLYSPLSLGGQNIQYNKFYMKEKSLNDPIRIAIVEKIESKGHKTNWMNLEEGVRRIRNEPFAFHGARSPIYQIIQNTYQEDEKCGLQDIDYMNVVNPLLGIQKNSPYLEIIKNGALKLTEYGLKHRDEYRLYTSKPMCSSQTSFITIGFTECYFAIVAMGYGALLSIIMFALELLWHKRQNVNILKETVPTMIEEREFGK